MRTRLRDADARPGHVVRVARDGAQMHDVARLERERVDRDRRRDRRARPFGCTAPIVPDANLNVSPSPELMMYSNAAETRPKSSVASAASAMRPVGVRSTLSCAGATSTTDRRLVDDRLDRDDALERPVGESNGDRLRRDANIRSTSDRRVCRATIESAPTCATIPAASPRPRTRDALPTSVSMSLGSSTVVGRSPL